MKRSVRSFILQRHTCNSHSFSLILFSLVSMMCSQLLLRLAKEETSDILSLVASVLFRIVR